MDVCSPLQKSLCVFVIVWVCMNVNVKGGVRKYICHLFYYIYYARGDVSYVLMGFILKHDQAHSQHSNANRSNQDRSSPYGCISASRDVFTGHYSTVSSKPFEDRRNNPGAYFEWAETHESGRYKRLIF